MSFLCLIEKLELIAKDLNMPVEKVLEFYRAFESNGLISSYGAGGRPKKVYDTKSEFLKALGSIDSYEKLPKNSGWKLSSLVFNHLKRIIKKEDRAKILNELEELGEIETYKFIFKSQKRNRVYESILIKSVKEEGLTTDQLDRLSHNGKEVPPTEEELRYIAEQKKLSEEQDRFLQEWLNGES